MVHFISSKLVSFYLTLSAEKDIDELINIKCDDIILASGDGDFYEDIWDRDW